MLRISQTATEPYIYTAPERENAHAARVETSVYSKLFTSQLKRDTSREFEHDIRTTLSISRHFLDKRPLKAGAWANGWETAHDMPLASVGKLLMEGKAITMSVLKGTHRANDEVLSVTGLGLDFDHDVSIEMALDVPFIAAHAFSVYSTPSSTREHPRTRAFFAFDRPISVIEFSRYILAVHSAVKHLRPDTNCSDPARVFCGSSKGQHVIRPTLLLPVSVLESLPPAPIAATLPESHNAQRRYDDRDGHDREPAQQQPRTINANTLSDTWARVVAMLQPSPHGTPYIDCPCCNHENGGKATVNTDELNVYCYKCSKAYTVRDLAAALGIAYERPQAQAGAFELLHVSTLKALVKHGHANVGRLLIALAFSGLRDGETFTERQAVTACEGIMSRSTVRKAITALCALMNKCLSVHSDHKLSEKRGSVGYTCTEKHLIPQKRGRPESSATRHTMPRRTSLAAALDVQPRGTLSLTRDLLATLSVDDLIALHEAQRASTAGKHITAAMLARGTRQTVTAAARRTITRRAQLNAYLDPHENEFTRPIANAQDVSWLDARTSDQRGTRAGRWLIAPDGTQIEATAQNAERLISEHGACSFYELQAMTFTYDPTTTTDLAAAFKRAHKALRWLGDHNLLLVAFDVDSDTPAAVMRASLRSALDAGNAEALQAVIARADDYRHAPELTTYRAAYAAFNAMRRRKLLNRAVGDVRADLLKALLQGNEGVLKTFAANARQRIAAAANATPPPTGENDARAGTRAHAPTPLNAPIDTMPARPMHSANFVPQQAENGHELSAPDDGLTADGGEPPPALRCGNCGQLLMPVFGDALPFTCAYCGDATTWKAIAADATPPPGIAPIGKNMHVPIAKSDRDNVDLSGENADHAAAYK